MKWEYIAGFFDGEGSIIRKRSGYALMIPQTNITVLNAIKSFTGVGNVYPVKKRKSHWKDAWVYCVTDYSGVILVLKGMVNNLVVKKDLAIFALAKLDQLVIMIQDRKKLHLFRKNKARKLRKAGLTFRSIVKILNIDYGYARRLILGIK